MGAIQLVAVAAALPAALGASTLPPPRSLVPSAHPYLAARFAETGALTLEDFERAAATPIVGGTVKPVKRATHAAVSRVGVVSYAIDAETCAANTATEGCYDGDASSIDDDTAVGADPTACSKCGYMSSPSGSFADCLTCADDDSSLVVLYDDCTGLCAGADGVSYLETLGFATLDDSACTLYANCYDSAVSAETGGTNAQYIDGDDGDTAAPTECSDSTSWYYKKSKNTCADYVAKKSKYCKSKIKDDSDVSALDACRYTCNTCEDEDEDDGCGDSTSWYYKKTKNTCADYVAKKSKYCKSKIKDDSDVSALDACPITCSSGCSVSCADSTSWYYKKTKNTCSEYVTKKSKYCKSKVQDEGGVSALEACQVTCGTCV